MKGGQNIARVAASAEAVNEPAYDGSKSPAKATAPSSGALRAGDALDSVGPDLGERGRRGGGVGVL